MHNSPNSSTGSLPDPGGTAPVPAANDNLHSSALDGSLPPSVDPRARLEPQAGVAPCNEQIDRDTALEDKILRADPDAREALLRRSDGSVPRLEPTAHNYKRFNSLGPWFFPDNTQEARTSSDLSFLKELYCSDIFPVEKSGSFMDMINQLAAEETLAQKSFREFVDYTREGLPYPDLQKTSEFLDWAFRGALLEDAHWDVIAPLLQKIGPKFVLGGKAAERLGERTDRAKIIDYLINVGCEVPLSVYWHRQFPTSPSDPIIALIKDYQRISADITQLDSVLAARRQNPHGSYPLLERAAFRGDTTILAKLLDAGAASSDIDIGDRDAALIAACHQGYADIVNLLLERGADKNARNSAPLMEGCGERNVEIVRLLLKEKATIDAHDSKALILCVASRDGAKQAQALEIAKLLVDAGIPFTKESLSGLTAPARIKANPAAAYLSYMKDAFEPDSRLSMKRLFPTLKDDVIKLSNRKIWGEHLHQALCQNPVFRYVSHCAALAALLEGGRTSDEFFLSLVRQGVETVNRGQISFKELTNSISNNFEGFQNIPDVSRAFVDHVLVPIALHTVNTATPIRKDVSELEHLRRILQPLGARILFFDRSPGEILKFSRKFHRPDKQIPLTSLPLYHNTEWAPLLNDEIALGEGYSIASLASHEDLAREGAHLKTCLGKGSYSYECASGRSHILSLRLNGEPVAHIELIPSGEKGDFKITDRSWLSAKQFRGVSNHEPTNEAKTHFNRFKSMVDDHKIALFAGPFGETTASKEHRQREDISEVELLTGIPFGQFPSAAWRHFSATIFIDSPAAATSPANFKNPLLRSIDVERLIMSVLASHQDDRRKARPPGC